MVKEMYGIIDPDGDYELSEGMGTEERMTVLLDTYKDEDGFDRMHVAMLCLLHEGPMDNQTCPCWEEMPYDDIRFDR